MRLVSVDSLVPFLLLHLRFSYFFLFCQLRIFCLIHILHSPFLPVLLLFVTRADVHMRIKRDFPIHPFLLLVVVEATVILNSTYPLSCSFIFMKYKSLHTFLIFSNCFNAYLYILQLHDDLYLFLIHLNNIIRMILFSNKKINFSPIFYFLNCFKVSSVHHFSRSSRLNACSSKCANGFCLL